MAILVRPLALLVLAAVLAACPARTRKTLVPDVPTSGDTAARLRFQEARAKFLRDGSGGDEFGRIAAEYPDDPIVPWAQLYAGIALVREGKYDAAAAALEGVAAADHPGLAARAALFLGVVKNYQGDPRGALGLLARGEPAIENDAERTEYLAAVAYATAAGDRPLGALHAFDLLYPRVSPTERAMIVARVEEVVAGAPPDALRRAFDELDDRRGPALAAVASRLALLAEQAGNAAEAERMRAAAAPARALVGLPRTIGPAAGAGAGGAGEPGLVGAVVPLAGKRRTVAEAAVAGLGVAAGVADGAGVVAVEVRAAEDAGASTAAVEDLHRANVIAVVGPLDPASVDAAARRAEELGMPLLSLAARPEPRATGRYVFHVRHSAEARARALAAAAIARGVTTFAVLAPEDDYGRSVTAAFADAVAKGGGSIATRVTYPADTKAFGAFAKRLGGAWQGVFVPEQADRLALITPAISAAGHIPKPIGTKKAPGGRPVLLLSTAEGVTGAYLAEAGRHSHGALLAPGYYPDHSDPVQKPFLDRFLGAYGRAPGVTEAYAYDAAQLVAAAGAGGRGALAGALARGQLVGLTGTIQFGDKHLRADPGVVYTVVDDAGAFALRVAK